jgi:hypothetical protein
MSSSRQAVTLELSRTGWGNWFNFTQRQSVADEIGMMVGINRACLMYPICGISVRNKSIFSMGLRFGGGTGVSGLLAGQIEALRRFCI